MQILDDEEGKLLSVNQYLGEIADTLPMENFLELNPDAVFDVRDEANALAAFAFRNTALEDLHAGEFCEELQDKSRISDPEMKRLMLEVTRRLAAVLLLMRKAPKTAQRFLLLYGAMYCNGWERGSGVEGEPIHDTIAGSEPQGAAEGNAPAAGGDQG